MRVASQQAEIARIFYAAETPIDRLCSILQNTDTLAQHCGAVGLMRLGLTSRQLRAAAWSQHSVAAATGQATAELAGAEQRLQALRRRANQERSRLQALGEPQQVCHVHAGDYGNGQVAVSLRGNLLAWVQPGGSLAVCRAGPQFSAPTLLEMPTQTGPRGTMLLRWSPTAPVLMAVHRQQLACFAFEEQGQLIGRVQCANPTGTNVGVPDAAPRHYRGCYRRRFKRPAALQWSPNGKLFWQHNARGLCLWSVDTDHLSLTPTRFILAGATAQPASVLRVHQHVLLDHDDLLVAGSPDMTAEERRPDDPSIFTFYRRQPHDPASWQAVQRLSLPTVHLGGAPIAAQFIPSSLQTNASETQILVSRRDTTSIVYTIRLDPRHKLGERTDVWTDTGDRRAYKSLSICPRPRGSEVVVTGQEDAWLMSDAHPPLRMLAQERSASLGFRPQWSLDGRYLSITAQDTLHLWDFAQDASHPVHWRVEQGSMARGNLYFSPNSAYLAVGWSWRYNGHGHGTEQAVTVIDLHALQSRSVDEGRTTYCSSMNDLAWHPRSAALGMAFDDEARPLRLRCMGLHPDQISPCDLVPEPEPTANAFRMCPRWTSGGDALMWLVRTADGSHWLHLYGLADAIGVPSPPLLVGSAAHEDLPFETV